MSATQQRAPPEDYLPDWVSEDFEFDHCYGTCGCGWATEEKAHPDQVQHELDLHAEYGMTPDCTLGTTHMIGEDGSEVSLQ